MAVPNINHAWKVLRQPEGFPVLGTDVQFVEEPIPALEPNHILIRLQWMSLDPYMRGSMNSVSYGRTLSYPRTITGGAIGVVVDSNNEGFAVGDLVYGTLGWQEYAVSDGTNVAKIKDEGFPISYYLGVLGMPGATAYFGFLEICFPVAGETVVVSAATGAVGQLVGQIAKIKGCTVIGLAGGEEKCKWAHQIGYDHCIDYRNKTVEQLAQELGDLAPKGVNCYFDNTGGPCTEAVLTKMVSRSRVSVCGQIAYYNMKEIPKTTPLTLQCLQKQMKVEGFIISGRWDPKKDWPVGHAQLKEWIKEGKLQVKEQVVIGLENAFSAFLTLFQDSPVKGGSVNFGKLVVKITQ